MSYAKLRLPQIKSFSVIIPDSSVILQYIFEEPEFTAKIDYFMSTLAKIKIPCEIMPKVNREIVKRLVLAAQKYTELLRRVKTWITKISHKSLKDVKVEKGIAQIIEQAFMGVFGEISAQFAIRYSRDQAMRIARVVETSVMLELDSVVKESKQVDMLSFLDNLEESFSDNFQKFCDKQSEFMTLLNAQVLRENDLLPTTKKLRAVLSRICGVLNKDDVVLLCQSVSRMYQKNRWCAVVTVDYTDILHNRLSIDKHTLLITSDPLYFLYHLDKKISSDLYPKDAAKKAQVPFASFINLGKPEGVV